MLENLEKAVRKARVLPFGIIEALTDEEYKKQIKIIEENIGDKDKLIELLGLNYG